jgi:hypothetical protein
MKVIYVRKTQRGNQEYSIQRQKTQNEDKKKQKTLHRNLNRLATRIPPQTICGELGLLQTFKVHQPKHCNSYTT